MIKQYFSQSLWITFLLCGRKVLWVSPRYMCYFPIKFPLQRKWKMEIPILFQYSWRHFSKNRKYYTFSRISWTRFVWIQVVCEMRNGKFHILQTKFPLISQCTWNQGKLKIQTQHILEVLFVRKIFFSAKSPNWKFPLLFYDLSILFYVTYWIPIIPEMKHLKWNETPMNQTKPSHSNLYLMHIVSITKLDYS